jgi:serine/threonine-protein kinase
MTCERGRVYDVAKLLDFGLVRIPHLEGGNISQELMVAGSPYYMSPEQAKGKELDGRSDIYSLGAVAYFLLTKQPPFVRESPIEVMMAHVRDPVIRPNALRPDVPADLQEVVLRCLQKDPARRFADAESLEQALGQCACAGQWTQQEAAAWWRRWATPDNTREHPPAR